MNYRHISLVKDVYFASDSKTDLMYHHYLKTSDLCWLYGCLKLKFKVQHTNTRLQEENLSFSVIYIECICVQRKFMKEKKGLQSNFNKKSDDAASAHVQLFT